MTAFRLAVVLAVVALWGPALLADDPKPGKPVKPPPPQERHPAREVGPVVAAIDREIAARLTESRIAASPAADDAEFLRRVYLDLAGHIPTWNRAADFLDSRDPEKRAKLIDELLSSADFGRHQAETWAPLLAPRDPANTKYQPDRFSPWLAQELNRNVGWDRIAAELVSLTGEVKDRPQSAFLMGYGEGFQPKADKLVAGIGTAFLGIQLQCAECHDHPFAPWTQADFWGIAAFFGKVRNTGVKGPPYVLTEDPDPKPLEVRNGGIERPVLRPGGVIVIPSAGGNKGAGREVAAKLLDGKPQTLDDAAPFRPTFVTWLTSRDNPYFARAFVNRTWARLFGRGLVDPMDQMHANNPPSHPALLDRLAQEFVASEFDVKHLFRCICNGAAYQRSSRPSPGNEDDAALLSHMAVKPVSPEALYDSLEVVYALSKTFPSGKPTGIKPVGVKADPPKPDGGKTVKPAVGKSPPGPAEARDAFVKYFRGQGGANATELGHGIPQFLRRMNGEQFNATSPLVQRLAAENAPPERAIETLFLATLSRRPSADEQSLMMKYVAGRPNVEDGYSGVLWVLLNTGEFVLNR
jgi:hypothetical protein